MCGFIVPPGDGHLLFFQMSAHVELYEAPEQEGDHQDQSQGFDALRFFEEDGVDHYGIFEEAEVVLDAVLILVGLEDLFTVVGNVAVRRSLDGDIGNQDKTSSLLAYRLDGLGILPKGAGDGIAHLFDGPCAIGFGPSSGIEGLLFDTELHVVETKGFLLKADHCCLGVRHAEIEGLFDLCEFLGP